MFYREGLTNEKGENDMTIRDEVMINLEEAYEELESIKDFKIAPYAKNPDFPDKEKDLEFEVTEEEEKSIDEIMLDLDSVCSKLYDLIKQMKESD